jgi:lysophospholipid acyltransferase (LPLAT)-like uncharacterized protein
MLPPRPTPRFSLSQRATLWLTSHLAALLIAAIGITLHFEVIVEEGAAEPTPPTQGIYCFWHQCTFLAGWYFRHFHPHVLISRSFDGELIARTLGLLGYQAVRGSSSRGAVAGLRGLRSIVDSGGLAIFTADGPRGPIFQAKSGAVKLAQLTGAPIGSFHIAPRHAWTLGSWDRFLIPKPFSRVAVSYTRMVPPPPAGADATALETTRQHLDEALERARHLAEARVSQPTAP